ncbi:SKA complex subunit 3 isoform 2-T2 [Synchiropus picturatus]
MDTTGRFFWKLKKLAVTLETETVKLQRRFANQQNDDDDDESSSRALRAFHEINCDVQNLKGLVVDTLTQQNTHENKVTAFMKSCKIVEQHIAEDISKVKSHWEKYGYQAPCAKKPKVPSTESKDSVEEDKVTDKSENKELASLEEPDGSLSPVPNVPTDRLRTPQMSDYGLSEMHLKRKMAEWISEAPLAPELSVSQPSMKTPELPVMSAIPKCVLKMDEEELQTPQMAHFGISDETLFLNNDFTMDLFRKDKDVKKPARSLPDPPITPVNAIKTVEVKDDDGSPKQSVVCTPGNTLPATPELPVFKTPFMKHLLSKSKPAESQPEFSCTDDLHETPVAKLGFCEQAWDDDVTGDLIPVMPKLESQLGNTLLSSMRKLEKSGAESFIGTMDMDGPTQEFHLRTLHHDRMCMEPSTPEMPDLSSVTLDICKLVSQTYSKDADVPKKGQRSLLFSPKVVKQVSESEFLTLPAYLRQMSLPSLNQTVVNLNQFISEHQGEKTEFQMEELTRVTKAGTRAPIYILCLSELRRLKLVGGARNTSVYRLNDEI